MNNTPPEVIEKWRQEFEEAFTAQHTGHKIKRDGAGNYTELFIRYLWKGFVLGRQSVCIDLPAVYSCDYHVIERARKLIEAQGYTTN